MKIVWPHEINQLVELVISTHLVLHKETIQAQMIIDQIL